MFYGERYPEAVFPIYGLTGLCSAAQGASLSVPDSSVFHLGVTGVLNRYPLDEDSTFLITGLTIDSFSSDQNYQQPLLPLDSNRISLFRIPAPFPALLPLGGKNYMSSPPNRNHAFRAFYQIPGNSLPANYTLSLIFSLSVCLALGVTVHVSDHLLYRE